jgi:hypothetical protein
MEYKRYIFLDIDGVLNHPEHYVFMRNTFSQETLHQMDMLAYHCDTTKLALLNQLEDCEVVLSTSWPHDYCQRELPKLGLKLPIIGGIDNQEVQEKWIVRGNSIAASFVKRHSSMPCDSFVNSFQAGGWWYPDITYNMYDGEITMKNLGDLAVTYVILDDCADMLMDQKNHFIHVNAETGLTAKDIRKAKKILNID